MKLVVRVKLLPTPVQASALEATLTACNEAATWAASVASMPTQDATGSITASDGRERQVRDFGPGG
ncbi:hypothetical protein ACFT7S_01755 [Streptomyces sp. NPDC057136]|uniref:hypothetical protein n=1 Tax=Streptomyces sp. NPDC057136 TaxID=3346029 RepID=UPI0036313787